MSTSATRLPTYAISHGGGPWPWIKDLMPVDWTALEQSLQSETVVDTISDDRWKRLGNWELAPVARRAHPREDHFLPLLAAAGAAEDEVGVRNYHERGGLGVTTFSAYRIGELAP